MKMLLTAAMTLLACMVSAEEGLGPDSRIGYFQKLEPESVSLWTGYRSKYIFSNGGNIYDDPVLQADLFLLSKCGLMAELWYSMPADASGVGKDYATELELIVGWAGQVKGYDLSLGVGYYDLHPAFSFEKTDYTLLACEAAKEFRPWNSLTVSPFFRAESYFRLDGFEPGVTLPRTGVRYKWEINRVLAIGGRGMVVYDPGIIKGDEAFIGNAEASLLWKLGNHLNLDIPYVKFVAPLSEVGDGRKEELVWGLAATYKF
jgi:hypothetical protein